MKAKNVVPFILFSLLFCLHVQGQKELEGLIKVGEQELKNKITFKQDIADLPFYDLEGEKMDMNKVNSLLDSYKFFPQFYINENNEVEAVVLRKMLDETPSAMAKMNSLRMLKKKTSESPEALEFSVKDMEGKSFELSELKGKVVVINFWFVNCKPCVDEMPGLNKIVEKFKNNQNVIFLAFSFDKKNNIELFLKKHQFLYNIIPESKQVVTNYGVRSFPTNLIMNQEGKVVYKEKGFHHDTIFELENTISSLIK
ncbi:peroxiredoxin family protein [Aquimarina aggregata]|uniref:peroxiredoxin family protein n=1 Tax=Aquimarina aggregata TaxID=1642818 RepID=UPI00248FC673|nr:TlpA disulfide reductase family protein [Aquimarina aggregata]